MSDDTNAAAAGAPTDARATSEQRSPSDSGASGASTSHDQTDIKNPEAKRYADEAAALRVKQKDLEAKLAEFEKAAKAAADAKLTEEEKREREHGELQTKVADYELRLQRQGLRIAGYELAQKLNIADIGAALALVETEHGSEVKYGADHAPANLDDLLKAVLKEHPALVSQATNQRPAPSAGAAMSPARSSVQPAAGDSGQQLGRHTKLGNLGVFGQ